MSTIVEKLPFEYPPAGICKSALEDVTDVGMKSYGGYPEKDWLKLDFITEHLSTRTGRPLLVSYYCTKSLGRKSKLSPVVKALMGVSVLPLGPIEIASLIGRKCRLVLTHVTKDDGATFANIVAVLPPEPEPATSAPLPESKPAVQDSTPAPAVAVTTESVAEKIHAVTTRMRNKKAVPFETPGASAAEGPF